MSTTATTVLTTTVDSPVGVLTLTAEEGRLTRLAMAGQRHAPEPEAGWRPDRGAFTEVVTQLEAWFAGERTDFDVPLAPHGTGFQQEVWAALLTIPYGETRSYGELAASIGRPGASRAVGLANGRNPIAIIIPCHRVIGADGSLTGYGGGIERKTWLLDHEATHAGGRLPLR